MQKSPQSSVCGENSWPCSAEGIRGGFCLCAAASCRNHRLNVSPYEGAKHTTTMAALRRGVPERAL
jgi:hypothetical protein